MSCIPDHSLPLQGGDQGSAEAGQENQAGKDGKENAAGEELDLGALLAEAESAASKPPARPVASAAARLTVGGEEDLAKKRRKKEAPLALADQGGIEEDDKEGGKASSLDMQKLMEEDWDMYEVATKHGELSRTSGKIVTWWQLRVPLAFQDDWDGRNLTGARCLLQRDV